MLKRGEIEGKKENKKNNLEERKKMKMSFTGLNQKIASGEKVADFLLKGIG